MTVRVGIVSSPLDPTTWEEFETDDVCALLAEKFPTWPTTARIFDLEGFGDWTRAAALIDPSVLARRDVTPRDEGGVERLAHLKGPLMVTIPPGDPITAIIAVVSVVLGIAAAFLLMPKIPGVQRQPSPNNALSDRTNQARPNGRIADIFGTVESTPDLLMVPYSVFENNIEVEVAYMIVARGIYAISRVRDGDTSIASIAGSSAAIYGPNTSPNSGDPPQLQIGAAITEQVMSVVKLNDVNGQTLKPSNLNRVQGEDSIRFVYPDSIETNDTSIIFSDFFSAGDAVTINQADISGDSGIVGTTADARFNDAGEIEFDTLDPSTAFAAGENITIINGTYAGDDGLGGTLYVDLTGTYLISSVTSTKVILDTPSATNSDWNLITDYPANRTEYRSINFSIPSTTAGINLNGNYTVLSVTTDTIVLNNPDLVNSDWDNLAALTGGHTDYVSPSISRSTESWVGPFIVNLDDSQHLLANIVALNGLFTLSKKKGQQAAMSVGVTLEATPINSNDAAIGAAETFDATLVGSSTERTTIGYSLWANPTFSGRCSIRMRRTTPTPDDADYGGITDEVKWRDAYGLAPIDQTEFGNVTTVMTRTVATPGALSVKNRKLNMRVTRKLPQRISGSGFGPEVATDNVADIICAMAVDPYIGRRSPNEIDVDNIYDTVAEVQSYFGNVLAGQFGYTFDDVDVSFEEMVQTVAQAIFCTAYRQGRVIRLAFEGATENSSLIFNSRNTMPGSQKRTVRFGPLDDHNGVDLDYTDPVDGAQLTFSIPTDRSATSARSADVPGVRSYPLAYWQAWRAWNKVQYQNTAIELEATSEAALVIPKDRILIADRNRPGILQGDIEEEIGTTIEISNPATLDPIKTWTIFLQHIDGTVEALGATSGVDDYHVVLSAAPRMPLSVDSDHFAKSTYIIVPDDDVQTRAFVLTERQPQSDLTETVSAINYSFLYYQNDELILWLAFFSNNFFDSGPYRYDGVGAGGAAQALDLVRAKYVFSGAGSGSHLTFPAFSPPASYTKMAWINRTDQTTAGQILSNAHEVFGFAASDQFIAGHDGTQVSATWPEASAWHHVAMAYDAVDSSMTLYFDGLAVDTATAVPARTLAQLVGLDGLLGLADDVRLYKRALTPSEVREIRVSSWVRSAHLALEDGVRLTTEDGQDILME